MNKKIEEILSFDTIKHRLTTFLATANGKVEVDGLHPIEKSEKIKQWLAETADAIKILRLRGGMPVAKLEDVQLHLKRLEIGASLNGLELAQISRLLRTATEISRFFDELKDSEIELNELYAWSEKFTHYPEINQRLRVAIDEDGRVTDEGSSELRGIRQAIKRIEGDVRARLNETIRGKNAKYLSDSLITIRNNRYVIPVKQEYRSVFGGVVHDQSATGQTLFIEPKQVVELNNSLRQKQINERQEIERILAELSEELSPFVNEIKNNAFIIGHFDFVEAKARLAKEMKATIPMISEENHVALREARHPLIDPEKAVANDIMIGKDFQTVVITGPNTGGKTITLKTLGLLQLMAQAGLAIPAGEESQVGIFDEIFADIGDEQSIEQSLSTFSSHMTNIVRILRKMDEKTLILFDELGAGTDPQEGAALAIAILDKVGESNAYVMASTHYPELKVYGYNRVGAINASMEFDIETLQPTYRLLIGVPGRSNAFDISKRLGLMSEVIDAAKGIIDSESQDLNEMIADLENRRKMAEIEYHEAHENVAESEKLLRELNEMYQHFMQEREKELTKSKKEANKIVETAEEQAEKIISDLREKQKTIGTEKVKEHELIDAKTQLANLHTQEETHLSKNKVLKKAKAAKQLQAGDEVIVESYGQRGSLLSKNKDGSWVVQMGILKMNVKENEMTPTEKEAPQKTMTTIRQQGGGARTSVPAQIDLRGVRYEEALAKVDSYLDAAILSGYAQVTIVHGKGTGALRTGITEYLKNHRSVKHFEFAPSNAGGNGATIVQFK